MASRTRVRQFLPTRWIGWGGTFAVLCVPLIAGFPWEPFDYVFAGSIFAILGGTFELAVRRSGNPWYRGGVAAALVTVFLLVWINGAVGIVGSEDNPANLIFLGVIILALAGALVARFEPAGMGRAMALAAAGQLLIAVATAATSLGANEPPYFPGVLILIVVFAPGWLIAGWCFHKAAK